MAGIKCRLIEPIGLRYEVNFYWETKNPDGATESHISRAAITKEQFDARDFNALRELFKGKLPVCELHGESTPEQNSISTGERRVWNTEDGENNHPGDMYWAPWLHDEGFCIYWDNCKDPRGHLIVVMPNNDGYWDTDSRASNCTMKEDKTHRCWVKHGEPPNITVDKQGHTCKAGAGSIQMIHWHGYLRNGELVV